MRSEVLLNMVPHLISRNAAPSRAWNNERFGKLVARYLGVWHSNDRGIVNPLMCHKNCLQFRWGNLEPLVLYQLLYLR